MRIKLWCVWVVSLFGCADHGPLTRYVTQRVAYARRECRERFPRCRPQRKPLVSDPGMHHGTCVTHVPWCMSGSLASGGGENVPGIPGAWAPAIFRIWQEAHGCRAPGGVSLMPWPSYDLDPLGCYSFYARSPPQNGTILRCYFQWVNRHWWGK